AAPHRPRLAAMRSTISSREGWGRACNKAAARMICPDWQYPHCGTCSAIHAFCKGWSPFGDRPSIVVTERPSALSSGVRQANTAAPSRCTVQAPHRPAPQPNFVPTRPRCSRNTHNSAVSGAACTSSSRPLIVRLAMLSLQDSGDAVVASGAPPEGLRAVDSTGHRLAVAVDEKIPPNLARLFKLAQQWRRHAADEGGRT